MQTVPAAMLPTKIAHVRMLGQGDPGWGQTQKWQMVGADPSVSFYDVEYGSEQSNLSHSIGGNMQTHRQENPTSQVTTTRNARESALHSSVPAARFFQGYFATSFSWLAPELNLVGKLAHQPISMNWNPHAPGSAELHPATVYNPFPPGAALWPKAV